MSRLLWSLAVLLLSSLPVSAGDLSRQDFAYGIDLQTAKEAVIHTLEVPDDVYRTVRRHDLGDLRVFNGDGEILPHALRPLPEDRSTDHKRRPVSFFPLAWPAASSTQVDLAVIVQRGEDDLIVGLSSAPPGAKGAESAAYLLDLGRDHPAAGKLELHWKKPEQPLTTVSLLDSDDLLHWRVLVDQAILADLEFEGYRVVRREIAIAVPTRRYLKMIGKGEGALPQLERVEAVTADPAPERARRWASLGPGKVGREGNRIVVDYQDDYHLAADRVRLRFAGANSMVRAIVQSRPDAKAPWANRCTDVFYTLQVGGTTIDRDVCTFVSTADRLWRLAVIEDGAGVRNSQKGPTLELGWKAAELLFVARGPAPYTLAFGSGRVAADDAAATSQMVLQAVSGTDPALVRPAVAGGKIELGGSKALQAPPLPLPWRRWLLWAVLATGVLLLAAMVRHLWLEMRRDRDV